MELARFIGAFLGDGWAKQEPRKLYNGRMHTDYAIGLSIGFDSQEHTSKYKNLLERVFPEARWRYINVGIACSCKSVHNKVVGMGISDYCDKKRLPAWIMESAEEMRMHCFAGYMDADGHVLADAKNLSRSHLGSCNIELLEDMRALALSVGLTVTPIRTYERSVNIPPWRQTFHQCWVSGLTSWKIPFWHEEKRRRSQLLMEAQKTRKRPRYARSDSGTWKSTPHIIVRKSRDT